MRADEGPPPLGGFDFSRVPTPGSLPSKAKKMLMLRGQHAGGGSLGLTRRSWKSGKAYIFEVSLYYFPSLKYYRGLTIVIVTNTFS